jgi:hypothetical protein
VEDELAAEVYVGQDEQVVSSDGHHSKCVFYRGGPHARFGASKWTGHR